MNIVQLYDYIGQIAQTIPIVHSYSNQTPYEYWNTQEVKYGSVIFAVKTVRTQNNIAKFDCVLYYGDRLNESKSNRDSIQSDAIGVLENIVSRLNCSDRIESVTYPYQTTLFEQKFADTLAGAYTNISIDLPASGNCCDYNLLDDYYTKTQIDDKLDKIEVGDVDLSDYYTKAQIDKKLSEIEEGDIDLTNYYTKKQIDDKGFLTSVPSEYVTENELAAKKYITSIPSEYVTENELESKGYLTAVPPQYVTETELEDRLKDVGGNVDLTGYATEAWVEGKGYLNTAEVDKKIQDAVIDGVDLTDYYTKQQIDNKGYLTSIPSEYVTENELENKGYLTAVPSQYVTETELESKGYLTSIPSQYVTENELEAKKYLTAVPSEYVTESELSGKNYVSKTELDAKGYATKTEVDQKIQDAVTEGVDLTDYYTKQQIDSKGYLTEIPSEYVTETELDSKGYLTSIPSQYVTEAELEDKGYLTSVPSQYITETELENRLDELNLNVDLTDYYTKQQIDNKGFVTNATLVNKDYATRTELNEAVSNIDLSDYYTKTESDTKYQPKGNYLTSIPSEYVTETELSGKNYATKTEVEGKQNQLVSGTNIKTINGESILGSGNIEITGGSGDVDLSNYYNKEEIDAMVGAVNQILGSLINDLDTEALELQLNNILNEA